MSRSFASNADHLDVASAPVLPYPYSVTAWAKISAIVQAVDHVVVQLGTSGSGNNFYALNIAAGGANAGILADERDATTTSEASTTGFADNTVWHNITAVFANSSSRSVYFDGVNKVTNTATRATGVPNRLRIGAGQTGTAAMKGLIAHVAIWNIALADADVLLLASGPPNNVQPANLIDYWTLNTNASPEVPLVGANNLTVTGTLYSSSDPFYNIPMINPSWNFVMP